VLKHKDCHFGRQVMAASQVVNESICAAPRSGCLPFSAESGLLRRVKAKSAFWTPKASLAGVWQGNATSALIWFAKKLQLRSSALLEATLGQGRSYISIPHDLSSVSLKHAGMFSKKEFRLDGDEHSTFAFLLGQQVTFCSTGISRKAISFKLVLRDGRKLQVTWRLLDADTIKQVFDFEGHSETFYLTRVPSIPTGPKTIEESRAFALAKEVDEERRGYFQWMVAEVVRETYMLPLVKEVLSLTTPHDISMASW